MITGRGDWEGVWLLISDNDPIESAMGVTGYNKFVVRFQMEFSEPYCWLVVLSQLLIFEALRYWKTKIKKKKNRKNRMKRRSS